MNALVAVYTGWAGWGMNATTEDRLTRASPRTAWRRKAWASTTGASTFTRNIWICLSSGTSAKSPTAPKPALFTSRAQWSCWMAFTTAATPVSVARSATSIWWPSPASSA